MRLTGHRAESGGSAASKRRGVVRAVVGLWLGFYAVMVMVVPVLDGREVHAPTVIHWEDTSGGHCPTQHESPVCHLVQILTASASLPVNDSPVPASLTVSAGELAPHATLLEARTGDKLAPSSRAPPTL